MKILQLVQTLDPSTGGVARAVVSLSEALQGLGHTVEIVTLDNADASWISDIAVPVHALGHGLTSYRYSSRLRDWLDKEGNDYTHVIVHGLWQYLSLATWQRYARTGTPYYVFPHGMLDPWFKRTYPLKHLKKWLYWPWGEYRVLRDARAVFFTSEEERFEARKSFWLYRAREEILPLGIESPGDSIDENVLFEAFPQLRDQPYLLFLGRLHPKKGCDLLVEALARLEPNERPMLVLAGPDQVGWQSHLQARARSLNLTNIIFAGMLEGEMKWAALRGANAFILPSHQENFGMAVVEALAVSTPVLLSRRVNIWREVEQDNAGYAEEDDLLGTTRLLRRWLETPATTREQMRINAKRCFRERYDVRHTAESLVRFLEGCERQ